MDVQALTTTNPQPYTLDPTVTMADSTGDSTDPVTFKLFGKCGGWTGQPVEATGDAGLLKDQLNIPKAGSTTGWDSQHSFELTGLQPGKGYYLTFIHGTSYINTRYLEITVDTDGNYDLAGETIARINNMLNEKTVYFTANADGKLVGSIGHPGTAEGNLAGIRLAEVPEPGALVLLLTAIGGLLSTRPRQ